MTTLSEGTLPSREGPHAPARQVGIQIGHAAAKSGVSAKMIRYYESVGLIRPATRSEGNYRTYDRDAVRTLRFIARARDLGFPMDEIAELLRLWREPERSSAEVKAVALGHIAELDEKISALRDMRAALKHLSDNCHGDDRPACPILDELSGDAAAPKTRPQRRRHHG